MSPFTSRLNRGGVTCDPPSVLTSPPRCRSSGWPGGGLANARGRWYYEHNQDGGGGWSASISLAIFSVSYDGNGGSVLQKSTDIDYLQ